MFIYFYFLLYFVFKVLVLNCSHGLSIRFLTKGKRS